jgi:hypothetical protein
MVKAETPGSKRLIPLDSLSIAHALAERGARTSIIEVLAGITQPQARNIIREVTGEEPRSGLLPLCASTLISTRRRHAEASVAGSLYDLFRKPDDPSISAHALIHAWDTYMLVSRHSEDELARRKFISITEMYVVARDLRVGVASMRRCQICFSKWLFCPDATRYAECPHCRLLAAQTCSCGLPKLPGTRLCHTCYQREQESWKSPRRRRSNTRTLLVGLGGADDPGAAHQSHACDC